MGRTFPPGFVLRDVTFRSYCTIQKQTQKCHQVECREFPNQLIFAYPWMKDISSTKYYYE